MATQKQIEANRRNASKSTGPRTPEGRARSSRNALKHGLASEHVVLDTEDPELFGQLLDAYRAEFQPDGPLESDLVDQIAIAAWRLRRFRKFETGYFNMRLTQLHNSVRQDADEPLRLGYLFAVSTSVFGSLARYEAKIERSLFRSLSELDRHRKARATEILQDEPNSSAPEASGASSPACEPASSRLPESVHLPGGRGIDKVTGIPSMQASPRSGLRSSQPAQRTFVLGLRVSALKTAPQAFLPRCSTSGDRPRASAHSGRRCRNSRPSRGTDHCGKV